MAQVCAQPGTPADWAVTRVWIRGWGVYTPPSPGRQPDGFLTSYTCNCCDAGISLLGIYPGREKAITMQDVYTDAHSSIVGKKPAAGNGPVSSTGEWRKRL